MGRTPSLEEQRRIGRIKEQRGKVLDAAEAIVERAEEQGRGLTDAEDREWQEKMEKAKELRGALEDLEGDAGPLVGRVAFADENGGSRMSNKLDIDIDDLPSFGGDGKHIGHDSRGREVRAYRAGDSIYRKRKAEEGWSDLWEEVDNPLGKYLRAQAVGPQDEWEARAVDSSLASGNLIPDPIRLRTLDDLKAQSVLGRAGVSFIRMDSADLDVTRVAGGASHSWSTEASTAASTDASFASVTLSAHTLRGMHSASRELVADAPDFPRVLETELRNSLDEELQRVVFNGSGSGEEPQGLYNSTGAGVTKLDFGSSTNGTVPASSGAQYDEIVRAQEQLLNSNVPEDGHAYVWAPRTNRQFNSLSDANHQPLMKPPALDDVDELVTTAVPTTLAPGGETDQSAIFYGRYGHLAVGMRIDPSVEILRERSADTFEIDFLSFLRADVAPTRPDGFAVLDRVSST